MPRRSCLSFVLVAAAFASAPSFVRADDSGPGVPGGSATPAPADDDAFGPPPAPGATPTIRPHSYTLAECLALADRHFPNLWAARARLALAHAQLEEARWTPWFQWTAQSAFGVLPPILGTVDYTQSTLSNRNITFTNGLPQPFFQFNVSGVVPLYTFGKIEDSQQAAEANVRVSEWDMEKWHQAMRMDIRRAYYGVLLARDASDVIQFAIDRLGKAIQGIKSKIAKGEPNVSDTDRLRIEEYRQEVIAQSLQAPKSEAYGLAALRFMTGIETNFDVPDEPLRRPDRPLAAVAQYLEAARVLRPDVNMARAGVVARTALVGYNRARLLPDFGLGLGADFISTPSAVQQQNAWANDPFNHFYYYFSFGMKWSLDLLPQAARVSQAESQLEEVRALERLALGNATLEVEKAYADTVEAKGREEVWDKAEHLAKQWISTVQDNIDLGVGDERALLDPLRAYGNARVQHLYALMDYNVTMSSLALASGWDTAAPTGE
jgi:multidrug efflux system outer membrane protein